MKIICVGKVKEKYLIDAIKEYEKRISKYTKIEIIEVKDYSMTDIKKVLDLEKNEILKHISNKDYIITLEIEGVELSSLEFSEKMNTIINQSNDLVFIIGGSYGLSPLIKAKAKYHLSFSKMTFPHQLFRVLLLEQIYRCYKIINNESYHK